MMEKTLRSMYTIWETMVRCPVILIQVKQKSEKKRDMKEHLFKIIIHKYKWIEKRRYYMIIRVSHLENKAITHKIEIFNKNTESKERCNTSTNRKLWGNFIDRIIGIHAQGSRDIEEDNWIKRWPIPSITGWRPTQNIKK